VVVQLLKIFGVGVMSKKRSGAELVETFYSIHLLTSEILANITLSAHKISREVLLKNILFFWRSGQYARK
jgi:hypothetical protein